MGRGLKLRGFRRTRSARRRRSPHEERGLNLFSASTDSLSRPTRGAWIEIHRHAFQPQFLRVAPRMEKRQASRTSGSAQDAAFPQGTVFRRKRRTAEHHGKHRGLPRGARFAAPDVAMCASGGAYKESRRRSGEPLPAQQDARMKVLPHFLQGGESLPARGEVRGASGGLELLTRMGIASRAGEVRGTDWFRSSIRKERPVAQSATPVPNSPHFPFRARRIP